jgi:hypothetical protein
MTTSCMSFQGHEEAVEAVERLLAAGVPGDDIRILIGARAHNPASEEAGGYGGAPVGAEAPVGRFAGAPLRRNQAMGAFAGDGDTQPTGTFATVDRETVTIPGSSRMREVRDIGHRRLRALLTEAGVDAEAAERDARALHAGRVLVLARASDDIAALLSSPTNRPAAAPSAQA